MRNVRAATSGAKCLNGGSGGEHAKRKPRVFIATALRRNRATLAATGNLGFQQDIGHDKLKKTATASTQTSKDFLSFLLRQEVEILSSDPEAGTANNTVAIGLSDDDDDDADFEEASSISRRKRTKASNGLGKNKQLRPSKLSPDSSGDGSPSRRLQEATPLDGTLEVQEQEGESESISAAGSLSVFSGRASPTVGASSAAVSASSFDLQENTKRRNAFQAGLKAAVPDDETPSVTPAGGSRSGDGRSRSGVGLDGKEGGDARSELSGATSSSRGKGKGAAAGRVKLTPMEQQVVDLKAKHPGVLLLVECGYRYRFFGEDALAAAKVRITLSGAPDTIRKFVSQYSDMRQQSVLRLSAGAQGVWVVASLRLFSQ